MCIALPRRILTVVDMAHAQVAVEDEAGTGQEIVSAALLVTPESPVESLVGAFALVHAGFIISMVDEAEAQSRLQVFAALRGDSDDFDLAEFHADMAEPVPV